MCLKLVAVMAAICTLQVLLLTVLECVCVCAEKHPDTVKTFSKIYISIGVCISARLPRGPKMKIICILHRKGSGLRV